MPLPLTEVVFTGAVPAGEAQFVFSLQQRTYKYKKTHRLRMLQENLDFHLMLFLLIKVINV